MAVLGFTDGLNRDPGDILHALRVRQVAGQVVQRAGLLLVADSLRLHFLCLGGQGAGDNGSHSHDGKRDEIGGIIHGQREIGRCKEGVEGAGGQNASEIPLGTPGRPNHRQNVNHHNIGFTGTATAGTVCQSPWLRQRTQTRRAVHAGPLFSRIRYSSQRLPSFLCSRAIIVRFSRESKENLFSSKLAAGPDLTRNSFPNQKTRTSNQEPENCANRRHRHRKTAPVPEITDSCFMSKQENGRNSAKVSNPCAKNPGRNSHARPLTFVILYKILRMILRVLTDMCGKGIIFIVFRK